MKIFWPSYAPGVGFLPFFYESHKKRREMSLRRVGKTNPVGGSSSSSGGVKARDRIVTGPSWRVFGQVSRWFPMTSIQQIDLNC